MSSLDDLVQRALDVRKNAYAPYSGYPVGAALQTKDGRTFEGVNVENAVYGLAICAERSAISAAVTSGAREIVAIAIASGSSPPASPCGSCRQALAELSRNLPIVLVNDRGEREETSLDVLLPRSFGAEDLKR